MIPALRTAQDPTRFALELIRTVMLLLCLVGWVMYPLELLLLEHWTEAWQSRIPFLVAVPGFVFTLWVLFDRKTPWVRIAFILTMWASVLTGVSGPISTWSGTWKGTLTGSLRPPWRPWREAARCWRPWPSPTWG
jgi:hypothetical protein